MTPKTVVVTPSTHELPAGWSVQDFQDAVQRAADTWSYPNVPCGVKVQASAPSVAARAREDGTNLIVFRGRTWCHNERCGPSSTYPLRATAMTTTYPENARGRAVTEADVEINGVAFSFGGDSAPAAEAPPRKWQASLDGVLVHELGHVLGLSDACGTGRRASGRPNMSDCTPDDRSRVMYPDGSRTRLAAADVNELCEIYPPIGGTTLPMNRKSQNAGCGCAIGATVGALCDWGMMLLALVIVTRTIARRLNRSGRGPRRRGLPLDRNADEKRRAPAHLALERQGVAVFPDDVVCAKASP